MAREYFNAYHSILEAMEPLNDAERGRLFTALLVYSRTGAVEKLSGNERFVFPGLRSQIDRDVKKYDDYCLQQSENGKKGGRPKNPPVILETRPFFEKPKKANEKEKEKEKTKDKENVLVGAPVSALARHKYGQYQNVLLSSEDYEKLQEEFPQDFMARIERLSEYIASTGKKYKNHLATIRSWARKDINKGHGIPCGASGTLGEAEMEAIQRVLREG